MKICPKCLARYHDGEIQPDSAFCIECYGVGEDVRVVDLDKYLGSVTVEDFLVKRAAVQSMACPESSKRLILRRIDSFIEQLNKQAIKK